LQFLHKNTLTCSLANATFDLPMYNYNKNKDKYFCLGEIIKTHSYHGGLVFVIDVDGPEAYDDLSMIFINIEGSLVPWFVDKIIIQGDKAIVKLEDIDSIELARSFVKRDIYLPIEQHRSQDKEALFFHEVIGFKVIDTLHGEIGIVNDILERPEQKIIRIMHGDKEILVPLNDEMISKVDKKESILYLDTPEGLVDLYI
jgi:16S rRNA processing protein RimM